MRSLKVIVLRKLYEPLADASVTAHPRVMEAVDSHFEGVKLFFDEVSLDVVKPTAQSYSREGSLIAVAINEKHSI